MPPNKYTFNSRPNPRGEGEIRDKASNQDFTAFQCQTVFNARFKQSPKQFPAHSAIAQTKSNRRTDGRTDGHTNSDFWRYWLTDKNRPLTVRSVMRPASPATAAESEEVGGGRSVRPQQRRRRRCLEITWIHPSKPDRPFEPSISRWCRAIVLPLSRRLTAKSDAPRWPFVQPWTSTIKISPWHTATRRLGHICQALSAKMRPTQLHRSYRPAIVNLWLQCHKRGKQYEDLHCEQNDQIVISPDILTALHT